MSPLKTFNFTPSVGNFVFAIQNRRNTIRSNCTAIIFFTFLWVAGNTCSGQENSIENTKNTEGALGQTLEDFFSAALNYSPELKIAEQQLRIGTARKKIANSRLLPSLRGNASVSDNERVTSDLRQKFDGNRYSLQLTQTLFNWELFQARDRAYLLEDIAELQYFGMLSKLLTDVAAKYLDALQSRDSLISIKSELEAVQNQLLQIEQLYSRQLTQITDLYQGQASVAAILSQQIQLESQLAQDYEALRSISGLSVGELLFLSDETDIPPLSENLQFWIAQSEENNHLLKSKELELQEATKGISQERGAYMPQISLIVQRQDSDVGFDNRPLDRSDNTYFGFDVSIPLYAGGGNRARVEEAKSYERIAHNELRRTRIQVLE